MTLRITCDDEIQELYLDGELQQVIDGSDKDWAYVTTLETSDELTVIAVKCWDKVGDDGLLASLENESGDTVFHTDTNWKCSSVLENDWQDVDFQATSVNWQNAVKRRDHLNSARAGQISLDADWIWTNGDQDKVYCRGEGIAKG